MFGFTLCLLSPGVQHHFTLTILYFIIYSSFFSSFTFYLAFTIPLFPFPNVFFGIIFTRFHLMFNFMLYLLSRTIILHNLAHRISSAITFVLFTFAFRYLLLTPCSFTLNLQSYYRVSFCSTITFISPLLSSCSHFLSHS